MKKISVIWRKPGMSGTLELTNAGRLDTGAFALPADGRRLDFAIEGEMAQPGAFGSVVTVRARENPFSFFVRDVRREFPIIIREYEVAVTEADDLRSYEDIVEDIDARGLASRLERFAAEPEESFETAAAKTKNMRAPTWLGLSRDVRMFEVSPRQVVSDSQLWDTITPMYHHTRVTYPELGDAPVEFDYFAGRGLGCRYELTRRLEKGYLPILNVISPDDDIRYEHKLFVTNERAPLTAQTLRGTNYLVADKYAVSPTPRTPEQQAETELYHDRDIFRDDETVLYLRVEAINTSSAPKYCFMRLPQPNVHPITELSICDASFEDGICRFNSTGNVFLTATLNGRPFSGVDSSVLLMPGEKAEYVCKIPHRPIPLERAKALIETDFDEKLAECTAFWEEKLSRMASVSLPERRIEEMMKAGYLHFDLVCFGSEPDGPVAPVCGVYTPIGTESTPVIQYLEMSGDRRLAERAVMYFIKKQRPDGFMQNFSNYMSETGLGLWNAAEHYKYWHDVDWLRSIKDNLIRGCDYIINWAQESCDESIRGHGYGMLRGKLADCAKEHRNFMLNCTTYGGLRSCADVLADIDPEASGRIGAFAERFREDLLESIREGFAVGPVVPLSSGYWCPSIGLCADKGNMGLECLFANGTRAYTHGSMVIEDNRCGGGIYNTMFGVLEPDSVYARFIENVMADVLATDNVSFSQPYYTPHPYNNLKLGEVGAFLREFYNNMAAIADRETYTFWEHMYQVSPHKTHEEGWFLMRCRWMLFMDDHGELALFRGVPRAWLEDGGVIRCEGLASRFGRLSFELAPEAERGEIRARIALEPNGGKAPDRVTVRVPHPFGLRASSVSGGVYDASAETVTIPDFDGHAEIVLRF